MMGDIADLANTTRVENNNIDSHDTRSGILQEGEEDVSYVPDSLKQFLQQADQKLNSDLAELLSPIHNEDRHSVSNNGVQYIDSYEYDEDDDGEDNTIFMNILQQETDEEMKHYLMGSLQQPRQDQQHPQNTSTESYISKEMQFNEETTEPVMTMTSEAQELPNFQKQQSPPKPFSPSATTSKASQHSPSPAAPPASLQIPSPVTDKRDTDDALLDVLYPSTAVSRASKSQSAAKSESIIGKHRNGGKDRSSNKTKSIGGGRTKRSSSPSPLKQVERKLQKELDREAKRASIGSPPSVSTPSSLSSAFGLMRRNHRVAPVPEVHSDPTSKKSHATKPDPPTLKNSQTVATKQDPMSMRASNLRSEKSTNKPLNKSSAAISKTKAANAAKAKIVLESSSPHGQLSQTREVPSKHAPPAKAESKSTHTSPPASVLHQEKGSTLINAVSPGPDSQLQPPQQENVFVVQGPVSAHHATSVGGTFSDPSCQARFGQTAVQKRTHRSPSDDRMRQLQSYKTAKAKASIVSSVSATPPKSFNVRPAPTTPRPGGVDTMNSSVCPPHGGHNLETVDVEMSASTNPTSSVRSTPLNPRELEPITNKTTTRPIAGFAPPSQEIPNNGRRPLTKPDSNIGRLMKPTSASIANSKIPTSTSITTVQGKRTMMLSRRNQIMTKNDAKVPPANNSQFLRPATKATATSTTAPATTKDKPKSKLSEQERREYNARMRARMQALRHKSIGIAAETATNASSGVSKTSGNRSRDSKERLKEQEKQRLAKLKAKIAEKEERMSQVTKRKEDDQKTITQKQQSHDSTRSKPATRRRRKPTIPVAPHFATDKRLPKRELTFPAKRNEATLPLAASTDLLMRELRAPLPVPSRGNSIKKRKLTIPQAPKLATTDRHGEKATLTSPQKVHPKDDCSWYSSLRDGNLCPISKSASSVKCGPLTIPRTPNFQPIRQRPLPKSTAEKEKEEMEYFLNHPNRGRPVKLDALPPASLRGKKLTSPPRSTQEVLRTDERAVRSKLNHDHPGNEEVQFKAKPMPDFGTTLGATDGGHGFSKTRIEHATEPSSIRKIPSGASGLRFRRERCVQSSVGAGMTDSLNSKHESPLEMGIKPFKAKPMPNFIPKTIQITSPSHVSGRNRNAEVSPSDVHRYAQSEDEPKQFRARPMPNFDSVAIPVHSRDASSSKTPRSKVKEEDLSPPFHARPIPKSLMTEPLIPVRNRNPRKLRSPDSIKRPNQEPPRQEAPQFHALPVPSAILVEPSIPVRYRDPTKLRSPDSFCSFGIQSPPRSNQEHHARPIPLCISHPTMPIPQSDPSTLRYSPKSSPSELNKSGDAILIDRIEARARLKQRLAMRQAVKKIEKDMVQSSSTGTSPKAFTTSMVKERLSRATMKGKLQEPTVRDDKREANLGDVPGTITLPLKSPTNATTPTVDRTPSEEARFQQQGWSHRNPDFWDTSKDTPRTGNGTNNYPDSPSGEVFSDVAAAGISPIVPDLASDGAVPGGNLFSPEQDAELRHQTAVACALSEPDPDESESILQLAREVQQAAEDELSYFGSLHGSMDPRASFG